MYLDPGSYHLFSCKKFTRVRLHVVIGKIPRLTALCFVADGVVLLPVSSAASAHGRHGRVFTSGSQQPPTLTDFRLATQRMRTQCRHFQ